MRSTTIPLTPARADPAPTLRRTPVLRRCACGGAARGAGPCEECRKNRVALRRSAAAPSAPGLAPPLVHDVLRSPGKPLDGATRAYMEPRFGHSFADVRVHADGRAAESAAAVQANAYAVGRNVVFGAGKYAPASSDGRRLIAHELAHVVQQSAAGSAAPMASLEVGGTDAPEEGAAECAASAVAAGGTAPAGLAGGAVRLRREFGEEEDPMHAGMGERWRAEGGLPPSGGEESGYTDAIVKYRLAGCADPGSARSLTLQPVFLRSSALDTSPTGTSWAGRLSTTQAIWQKVGVSVDAASPVTLDTPLKTAGSTYDELRDILDLHTGAGHGVFVVDNDLEMAGGGATRRSGSADAQIVLSDHGTSPTLLAHEVGHILGLQHPPGGGDAGTIMEPSDSHSSPNPTRNTMGNYRRITWPLPVVPTCLHPDP
jgi:hypothetical protein